MMSNSSTAMDAGSAATLLAYLDRIGLGHEAAALIGRTPNKDDLKLLLQSHLKSVPFENLGQHTHPAGVGVGEVPRGPHVPTLEVAKTLKKIVFDRRGGFCWELNFAFAWLLRSLGYKVRVGNANVITPGGPIPGHLVVFVDGLGPEPLHVDPGFGDAPREPMPTTLSNPVTDTMIGDRYTFQPNTDPSAFGQTPSQHKRFGVVMMRERNKGIGGSPMVDFVGVEAFGGSTPPPTPEMTPPEPVYLLHFADDLSLDCDEFKKGLASVLVEVEQNPFSQKRMTIMVKENGFDFVGKDYWKEVRDGKEVTRESLEDEAAYRAALDKVAGIKL